MFKKIDIKDNNNSCIIEIKKDNELELTNINIENNNNNNLGYNNNISDRGFGNNINRNSPKSGEIILSSDNSLEIAPVCRDIQNNRSSDSVNSSFINRLFQTVKNKSVRKVLVIIVLIVIVVEEFVSLLK